MDFDAMIQEINQLLSKDPDTFSSSWILKRSPRRYRFIGKNVRTNLGAVDWDCHSYLGMEISTALDAEA